MAGNAQKIIDLDRQRMTAIIANELREATTQLHVSSLVAIGLVLFVVSFLLNTMGRLILVRVQARAA